MTLETDLQAAVTKATLASQKLHDVVNGNANTSVQTDSGSVKTLAKTMADIDQTLAASMTSLTAMRDQAVTSATAALTAKTQAQAWADNPAGQEVTPGQFSAKHWAQQASNAVRQNYVRDEDGDTALETERIANENKIRLKTAGVDRAVLDQTGKLGIGETSAPQTLLHIKNHLGSPEVFIDGNASAQANPTLTLGQGTPGTGVSLKYEAVSAQLQISSKSAGTDKGTHVRVDQETGGIRLIRNTVVGADIVPGNAKLQVQETTANAATDPYATLPLLRLVNTENGDGTKAVIAIAQGSGEVITLAGERQPGDDVDLVVGIRNSGTGYTEQMRIKGAGKVGIGTSTPTHRLVVGNTSSSNIPATYGALVKDKLAAVQADRVAALGVTATAASLTGYNHASGTALPLILNETGGNVGIGSVAVPEKLSVGGIIAVQNQSAAPAVTPGFGKIYSKSNDGKLYYQDETGQESSLINASAIPVSMPDTSMITSALLIIGSDGRLYSRGRDNQCGRGGTTEGTHLSGFAPVWLPDDFGPVAHVWCGWDYAIVASATQNKIATFGNPAEGVLGTGNATWIMGTFVINLPDKAVECVTNEMTNQTGGRGFIIRLANNDCYAYGWNADGCLDDSGTQTNNTMLTGYKLGNKYLHISGFTGPGGMVFGVDATNYKTYVWGYNMRGAAGLSHGGSIPYNALIGVRREVQVVPATAGNRVVKIVANRNDGGGVAYATSGFLTTNGTLYVAGFNQTNVFYLGFQGPMNNGDDQSIPIQLATGVADFGLKLFLGGWVKKTDGRIQTWGRNLDDWRGNNLSNDTRSGLEDWNGNFFVGKNTKVGWAASYIYDAGGGCALLALDLGTGKLYAAGSNVYNANGLGDNINPRTAGVTAVPTGGIRVKDFNFKGSGDGRHEGCSPVLIMENGQIWTTGYNHYFVVSYDYGGGDVAMHWVPNTLKG